MSPALALRAFVVEIPMGLWKVDSRLRGNDNVGGINFIAFLWAIGV